MDQFLSLIDEIKIDLSSKGIEALQIKQPPGCYTDFVPREFFQFAGFEEKHADINQQIELKSNWEQTIHTMQKRKLDSLKAENFEFRKMENEELETAHKFIDVCRQAQDLKINISYELLRQLTDSTDAYDIFGVFREGKISSLCIAVRVTDKVAYYYLPATSPMFRSQSPMVMLIAGMVDYYCKLNYDFLDLGISSVEGKAQESLRIFKERMGASQSEKSTWILQF
ncbi:MAG: GNAT family N-acetyltransferase [Cyclobacteriaceae bacterium]